jgi:small-conductance mechanosensitive channel
METQIIELTNQLLADNLWSAIKIFVISFILIGLVKSVASMLFEFVLVKTDIYGVGSTIYYNGTKAIIKDIGIRRITLYTIDNKETIIVGTAAWRTFVMVDAIETAQSKNK